MESTDQSSPAAPPAPDKWNADYLRLVHAESRDLLNTHTKLLADLRDQIRDCYGVIDGTIREASDSGHLDADGKIEAMRDLSALRNELRAVMGV